VYLVAKTVVFTVAPAIAKFAGATAPQIALFSSFFEGLPNPKAITAGLSPEVASGINDNVTSTNIDSFNWGLKTGNSIRTWLAGT